jgi:hypothetical protein
MTWCVNLGSKGSNYEEVMDVGFGRQPVGDRWCGPPARLPANAGTFEALRCHNRNLKPTKPFLI